MAMLTKWAAPYGWSAQRTAIMFDVLPFHALHHPGYDIMNSKVASAHAKMSSTFNRWNGPPTAPPVLFHHIHKTAGTALQIWFLKRNVRIFHNHCLPLYELVRTLQLNNHPYTKPREPNDYIDLRLFNHVISLRDPIKRFISERNHYALIEGAKFNQSQSNLDRINKSTWNFPSFEPESFGENWYKWDTMHSFLKLSEPELIELIKSKKVFFIRSENIEEDTKLLSDALNLYTEEDLERYHQSQPVIWPSNITKEVAENMDLKSKIKIYEWDDYDDGQKAFLIKYFKREYDLLKKFGIHYDPPVV